MRSFIEFIREQGVVGLAIGFVLGGAVLQLVMSLINDILNPLIGLLLGSVGGLRTETFSLFGATISWGNFMASLINFTIVALVVFFGFRFLRLYKFQKPKN